MPLRALDEEEQGIIRGCLVALLDGPFIDDWEFQTRLGFDRSSLRAILSARYLDYRSEDPEIQLTINNCMNEVVNGLNISPSQWERWLTVPRQDVQRTYLKWSSPSGC